MTSAATTNTRLIGLPPAVRSASLSLHMETREAYEQLRDQHDHTENTAEGSAATNSASALTWHRWAEYDADGIRYVIHDPTRHEVDPLGDDKRLAELRDMIVTVLDAEDMTGPDKVSEITRLTERMRQALLLGTTATYPDGTRDRTTQAFDAFADAAAAPGGPE